MKRISSIAILLAIVFQVTLASFEVNVATTGTPLTPRLYPKAAALSDGTIFINGGTTNGAGSGTSAEVSLFNTKTLTYSTPLISGAPKLYAHAVAVDDSDNVYYFGGNDGAARQNALWKCNVLGGDCSKLTPTTAAIPPIRTLSSMVYWKDTLIVFGGANTATTPTTVYNDVWQYDLATDEWTNRVAQAAATSPPARTATCAAVYNDEVIVSGGSNSVTSSYYKDAWILDLNTWTWTNVTATMTPSVAHADAACTVDGDHFLLYGGNSGGSSISKVLDMFHIPTRSWLAAYENTAGVARFGYAQAFVAGKWYLFGGSTTSTTSVNTLDVYTPDEAEYTITEFSAGNTDLPTESTENTEASTDNTNSATVTATVTASTENTDTNLPTENTETPSSTEETSTGVLPSSNPTQDTNTNTNTNTDDNDSSSVAVVASAILVVCMSVLAL